MSNNPLRTLNAIFASGTVSPTITLEFVQEQGIDIRFVLGYNDFTYQNKIYTKSAFQIALPSRNNSGFSDLNFGICDVNSDIYNKIVEAQNNQNPIYIILRQFNPTTTWLEYELKLLLVGVTFNDNSAIFTGSFVDTLNAEFPSVRYNDITAPGLKYIK